MEPEYIKKLPTQWQKLIQIGLIQTGHYEGTTMGIAGPKTIAAFKSYLENGPKDLEGTVAVGNDLKEPEAIKKLPTQWQKLIQIGLIQTGHYEGTTMGIAGPKTIAAFKSYLLNESKPHEESVVAGNGSTFGEVLLNVAKQKLGIREEGENTGIWVKIFQKATNWSKFVEKCTGWSWCAAFVCWCFRAAMKTHPLGMKRPVTIRAFGFEKWAEQWKSKGVEIFKPYDSNMELRAGDIVVFNFSHIGIVDTDLGTSFSTVEGNTNSEGSREGDGVYQKKRSEKEIRSIIRVT